MDEPCDYIQSGAEVLPVHLSTYHYGGLTPSSNKCDTCRLCFAPRVLEGRKPSKVLYFFFLEFDQPPSYSAVSSSHFIETMDPNSRGRQANPPRHGQQNAHKLGQNSLLSSTAPETKHHLS